MVVMAPRACSAPDAAVQLAGAEDEQEVDGLQLGLPVDVRRGAEQPVGREGGDQARALILTRREDARGRVGCRRGKAGTGRDAPATECLDERGHHGGRRRGERARCGVKEVDGTDGERSTNWIGTLIIPPAYAPTQYTHPWPGWARRPLTRPAPPWRASSWWECGCSCRSSPGRRRRRRTGRRRPCARHASARRDEMSRSIGVPYHAVHCLDKSKMNSQLAHS